MASKSKAGSRAWTRPLLVAALLLLVSGIALLLLIPRGGFGWGPNVRMSPPRLPDRSVRAEQVGPDDFYAARLGIWDSRSARRSQARTSLAESELHWVATSQDARVALMVSEETGFDTWGVETQVAEIPAGWHTGRHRHGEEAIYVVNGDGFAIVSDVRYDFHAGTTIGIPYGAVHQLYNTGPPPVRYVSATPYPLEKHLGLYHLEQLESCGPNQDLPQLPASSGGLDASGSRIRLLWEDALYRDGRLGLRARLEGWLRAGQDLATGNKAAVPTLTGHAADIASRLGHHSAWIRTMGQPGQRGFPNKLVVITSVLIDQPGTHGGKHAHMDAILYVVAGRGYSVVDGKVLHWQAGSSMHVQGPQTWHQHFNAGDEPSVMLCILSGLRPWLQAAVADAFPMLWAGTSGENGAEGGP